MHLYILDILYAIEMVAAVSNVDRIDRKHYIETDG